MGNGYSVETSKTSKRYYYNRRLHRPENEGPAVEMANGDKEWWFYGNQITEQELNLRGKKNISFSNEIFSNKSSSNESTMTIDKYRNKKWKNRQGYLHRKEGPAIECANGDKWWYVDGQRHRDDGPAVERANGDKEWWFYGNQITKQELTKHINVNEYYDPPIEYDYTYEEALAPSLE